MTNTEESLMGLIDRSDDAQIQIPNDIESAEDFVAWCRNVDRYPFDAIGIRTALEEIRVDSNGAIEEDLKTASRTFFKGHKRDDILNWMNEAFDVKRT